MKKFILTAAIVAFGATAALAADLPVRAYTKAPPIAPAYSWTGWYAGVNVGYGFNDPTMSLTPNDPVTAGSAPPPSPLSYNVQGVLGGAQVGYNWQLSPTWLVGVEADLQGSDIKGSASLAGFPFTPTTAQQNVEWFGTLRARLGVLATEKLLVFATGGLAYGSVKDSASIASTIGFGAGVGNNSFFCPGGGAVCFAGNRTRVQAGYAAGGGLEYAAWQNVSVKAEYLYVNLGSSNATVTALATLAPGDIPGSYNAHFSDLDFHVVRVGANWRF